MSDALVPRRAARRLRALLVPCVLALGASGASAQAPAPTPATAAHAAVPTQPSSQAAEDTSLREAVVSLPIAAALGTALAFRPRRRGTPPRSPAVIQTQIILALVGAVVMLVVGASLARAFGIVGAASLVRYRSKIEDPKDAGVMLSCLAIGLAAGVGIHVVAAVCTLFILAVLWVLESLEPEGHKEFLLKLKSKESGRLHDEIENILRRNRVKYELRTAAPDEVTYSVQLPIAKKTDRLTDALRALARGDGEIGVEWSDKKPSKD